jgi:rhodanese-related sulfurtransferase
VPTQIPKYNFEGGHAFIHPNQTFLAMKNLLHFFLLLGIIPALLLTGCKEDPVDPEVLEFETLTEYMVANDLDLPDVLNGWVKAGSALEVVVTDYSVPAYYVIDLRGADDFNAGHIKDAVNVPLANILDEAPNANGKKILVVCYTGQTAARATGALRLMGYEAYSLKWGMSGWHADLNAKWATNAGDYSSPNWVTSGTPAENTTFNDPVVNTGLESGASILEARVREMLSLDWTISRDVVLANPGDYFINNYWPQDSWDTYGHISGAYRVNEDLTLENINFLDPTTTMVTYCYTGQTSAITTAWLQVLGYENARSLMFGVNAINHSQLVTGTVGDAAKKSWGGAGSGSDLNFGYYDADGNLHMPL